MLPAHFNAVAFILVNVDQLVDSVDQRAVLHMLARMKVGGHLGVVPPVGSIGWTGVPGWGRVTREDRQHNKL